MGVGLNSPANRRKSAPRGTFTLHKNSVDEETPVAAYQEYPKFIGDDLPLAENAAHEQAIRDAMPKPAEDKPKGKSKKDDAA